MRWRTLARAPQLALLLDLDGTLIDFAPTLELATLDPEILAILRRLDAAGVQIVIVSGRPRESVEPMTGLVPGAWWVAEHGSWRWDTQLRAHPAARDAELEGLDERLASLLSTRGVRVERKSLSICIHWRLVPEPERADVIVSIELACDEWLEEHPAFERLAGVEMLEIRHHAVHKGIAVSWVRRQLPGARLIAVGDDVTDEDMFAELDDGDASVSVGPLLAQADAVADNVSAVRELLTWIADLRVGHDRPLPIRPASRAGQRKRHRFLVMSNRTPVLTVGRAREVGGLVSALEPALRDEQGIWLGWSGQEREHDSRVVVDTANQPARARFDLPSSARQRFYSGFCNSVLWPLFHGFPERVRGDDQDWVAYQAANERFARHAIGLVQSHATIWVHDYHLLLAARALRRSDHLGPIGLFLHIPFPEPSVLATIPWAREIVEAMLDFDLIGFQTDRDTLNFRLAAGERTDRRMPEIDFFPATIDPAPFRAVLPESREVLGLRNALGDRRLILGVDRLDYSKGIPERLEAYEHLLDRYPEWRRQISLLQISVPSRAEIPEYAELRKQVEGLVGRINGRFGETDWVPVRYLYRSYDQAVLAQLYRLADVALVTPLRDGMNLVAKEFVASQDPSAPGVLVLSRYAGAADSFSHAVITDPRRLDGMAADLDRALRMPADERRERHRHLLATLEREGDAKAWARHFLARLAARRLHPVL